MDVKQYIESGILEEYCMGHLSEGDEAYLTQMLMLYPEIKEELAEIELAIERLALAAAITPHSRLKKRILSAIDFDDTSVLLDIARMPAVDEFANYKSWLKTLDHLIPSNPQEDFFAEMIRTDESYQQLLIVTKNDVPEEEHQEFIESFFILKGQCECTVDNKLFKLNPGDFLEIPLNVTHDIKIVSPYVVGILQYRFL